MERGRESFPMEKDSLPLIRPRPHSADPYFGDLSVATAQWGYRWRRRSRTFSTASIERGTISIQQQRHFLPKEHEAHARPDSHPHSCASRGAPGRRRGLARRLAVAKTAAGKGERRQRARHGPGILRRLL